MKASNSGLTLPLISRWMLAAGTVALVAGLTACGQKKDDAAAAVDGRARQAPGVTAAPVNALGFIPGQGAYIKSTSNMAQSVTISSSQFSRNVRDFISSSWDPDGMGNVDDTSVSIQGFLEMSNATQFNLATSNLKIWIVDSFAKEKTPMADGQAVAPYFVNFKNASSGTLNGNQFSIVFTDAFQEVTLSGTFDSSVASGSLSFRNLQDAKGEQLKAANPMGFFAVNTCALLNCKKQ